MKVLSLVLLFASVSAQAFTLNCPSTDLKVTVKNGNLFFTKISYKGRNYTETAAIYNERVNLAFVDKDRGEYVIVSFLEEVLDLRSGFVDAKINDKTHQCTYKN